MTSRLKNNGFKVNPPTVIEDYPEKQNFIEENDFWKIEEDIVKYIQKIINLCKKMVLSWFFIVLPILPLKPN